MKRLLAIATTALLFACNDGNEKTEDASGPEDRPRDINEAVTDSTRIVNDSVIVSDTGNRGTDPTKTDTSGKKID